MYKNNTRGENMIIIDKEILNLEEVVTRSRRQLHQIPETEFDVYKTRQFIIDYLNSNGVELFDEFGKTAVIGRLKGTDSKESIAFRADMDALSIEEETGLEFKSRHDGFMHACGHDGHMASLLGLVSYLSNKTSQLKKDVIFIFQPAEEGPGGAEILVNEKVLEHFNVTEIFGMHLYPNVEEGIVACKPGALMAQNGEFDVIINGESAHGAQPHNGIDSIVAAADFIMKVQSILPRFVNPIEPGVVTMGKITGGERCNVIPKRVKIEGTIRTFSEEVFDTIKRKLRDFSSAIEVGHGCKVEVVFRDMYPAVLNDVELYNQLTEAAGKENMEEISPQMLAEDFAWYQKVIPGLFFFMGTGNKEKGFIHPLHHSCFDFDEVVLLKVIQIYVNLLKNKNILG